MKALSANSSVKNGPHFGNSSQRATVTLDTPTVDAFIETIGQKIRWRKSAAGQRALMTARLRNFIKTRDNHTCQYCSVSLSAEPHLLLEVDHIVPVSKGGLSTAENLQTLCWRCNRSKSNKQPPSHTPGSGSAGSVKPPGSHGPLAPSGGPQPTPLKVDVDRQFAQLPVEDGQRVAPPADAEGSRSSMQADDSTQVTTHLERLASLHDAGILSGEEFAAAKARLLQG